MDILAPALIWVDGACYRTNLDSLNVGEDVGGHDDRFNGDAADEFEDDDNYYRDQATKEDLEDEQNLPGVIEQLDNGRFRFAFHVASAFFALLIGMQHIFKIILTTYLGKILFQGKRVRPRNASRVRLARGSRFPGKAQTAVTSFSTAIRRAVSSPPTTGSRSS